MLESEENLTTLKQRMGRWITERQRRTKGIRFLDTKDFGV